MRNRGSGEQTTQREITPELPEEQGGQCERDEPGDLQDGKGDQPDSPRDSNDPERGNQEGDAPPGSRTGRTGRPADVGEGWGNLPQHMRDNFRAEDLGELPPRYRAWIDSYYRRLNERSRGK